MDYTYDDIGQLKTAKGKESGGATGRLNELALFRICGLPTVASRPTETS
jgi:hypothetical protein